MDRLAKESGFITRKRLITGSNFIDSLIFSSTDLVNKSLNGWCSDLYREYNVRITKQGLFKRIIEKKDETLRAIPFIERVINELITLSIGSEITDVDTNIKSINIKDSTKVKFDMKGENQAIKSTLSIQTSIDLINPKINLSVHEGSYSDHHESIKELQNTNLCNTLLIRDLGYVNLAYLQEIKEQEKNHVYCLNKLNPRTDLYIKTDLGYQKINLEEIKEEIIRDKKEVDRGFYLGEHKLYYRVIIGLVPEEVKQERIRKVNKYNKRKGHKTSKEYKDRCGYNILVTNLPETYSPEKLMKFYKLRWQIENLFKTWKSVLRINKINTPSNERAILYIYGRLILAILHWMSYKSVVKAYEISQYKLGEIIMEGLDRVRKVIFDEYKKEQNNLRFCLYQHIVKENKKGRMKVNNKMVINLLNT